jgi:MFS family permease
MGLVTGSAPIWFTLVLGVPIAHLSDRWDRVYVLAAGLATWSTMTVVMSLAQSYAALLIARIGVGIGEAACTAPAYSLIAELFDARLRARALSTFTMAVYLAEGISYSLGGWLADRYSWRTALLAVGLPGIGFVPVLLAVVRDPRRDRKRRAVGGAAPTEQRLADSGNDNNNNNNNNSNNNNNNNNKGRPGSEARSGGGNTRGAVDGGSEENDDRAQSPTFSSSSPQAAATSQKETQSYQGGASPTIGIGISNSSSSSSSSNHGHGFSSAPAMPTSAVLATVSGREAFVLALRAFFSSRVLILLSVAAGLRMWSGYALGFWIVEFYGRVHGKTPEEVGVYLAVLIPVAGVISVTVGGFVSDRWSRVSHRAQALTSGLCTLAGLPFLVMALMSGSFRGSLAFLFGSYLFAEAWIGPAVALVQRIVAPDMRSTVSSVYLFIISLIGSFGTLSVGRVNEARPEDKAYIRVSLIINVAGFYLLSGLGFVLTGALIRPGDIHIEEPVIVPVLSEIQLAAAQLEGEPLLEEAA